MAEYGSHCTRSKTTSRSAAGLETTRTISPRQEVHERACASTCPRQDTRSKRQQRDHPSTEKSRGYSSRKAECGAAKYRRRSECKTIYSSQCGTQWHCIPQAESVSGAYESDTSDATGNCRWEGGDTFRLGWQKAECDVRDVDASITTSKRLNYEYHHAYASAEHGERA